MRSILSGLMLLFSLMNGSPAVADIHAELAVVATELNRITPFRVDETTRLLLVESRGKQLIYHLEVFGELTEGVDLDEFNQVVTAKIKNESCSNPSMKYFADNNVELYYLYSDLEGMPLGKIHIKAQDC